MDLALVLTGLPRAQLDTVSERLFALGATGLQEDYLPGEAPAPRQPWDTGKPPPEPAKLVLRAWFTDPDQRSVERAMRPHLRGASTAWEEVEERDWEAEWRASFRPIPVSPRITVAPPWDAPEGALIVEPGQGFGTGEHPTTVQALRAVDALADGRRTALDVGCGSGILAIAAARLGLSARGIDVEEPAIRDAIRNAEANGVVVAFDTTPVAELTDPADLVLANLHAELVAALAADLVRLCGDRLVVAGVLADREHLVVAALDGALTLVHREQDGDWVCRWYARR
ncbi:MAG: 50S ribosomal protein L11 methyltransferase [Alphaproteobacteria bacterium]|nr:50S ribosomal protein L11 methyltransferase [Alphaproteobacteria bacterium]